MRTLTAFHSLKTAIKHIRKDIVAPFKESSNNGNCGQLFRPYWGSSAQCTDDELPHTKNIYTIEDRVVDVGHYRNLYTTHYGLAFMRTLTAFHSLKTAIKHISKDIVAPFKESSNNGNCGQLFRPYWGSSAQCTVYIYIYMYYNDILISIFG